MIQNNVVCKRCENWDLFKRQKELCSRCNNSQMVIEPAKVLCNRCGLSLRPLGTHNEQNQHGLENVYVYGGYDSYHLHDMIGYNFSICEKCLRELFNQFVIPPNVSDGTDDLNTIPSWTWEADSVLYDYKIWKDGGGHHQAYLDKKCNQVKNCINNAVYSILIDSEFTEDTSCEEHKEKGNFALNQKFVKFISNNLKPFL
jgi:hypothetical protein